MEWECREVEEGAIERWRFGEVEEREREGRREKEGGERRRGREVEGGRREEERGRDGGLGR